MFQMYYFYLFFGSCTHSIFECCGHLQLSRIFNYLAYFIYIYLNILILFFIFIIF